MNTRCVESRNRRAGPARPVGARSGGAVSALLTAGFIHPGRGTGLAARVDRYKVFASLGVGSMGMVVWGWDPLNARRVAIKFLRPELVDLPGLGERFLVEARHLERLRHPRIVPVIEISERSACPYYVMPLLDRGSLAGELLARRSIDPARVLSGALEIAEALAHAHEIGVVHRDVKPSNVLIDEQGRLCLADFGLARLESTTAANGRGTRTPEGTAAYMSPGLAAGEVEGASGDIYAFGSLVYEMLVGRPPYRGRTGREVLRRVIAGPPIPVREANPEAPIELAAIAEAAMARDRNERYAAMSGVLADLDRVRRGQAPLGPARLPPLPGPSARR